MEKHTEQLSEQVKDALTELGNIGAGNATTSLSVLLSSKLSMSAPTVKLYDFNELEAESKAKRMMWSASTPLSNK